VYVKMIDDKHDWLVTYIGYRYSFALNNSHCCLTEETEKVVPPNVNGIPNMKSIC